VIKPDTKTIITLKSKKERYMFEGTKTIIHNLIVGRLWIEHIGDMIVTCLDNQRYANVHLNKCGWLSKGFREFKGYTYNEDKNPVYDVYGHWHDQCAIKKVGEEDDEDVIWKYTKVPPKNEDYNKWKYSDLTTKLIKINEKLKSSLPKSDSRFRPDRIALEEANVRLAGKEKYELEELQRKKRKFRKDHKLDEFEPNLFERNEIVGKDYWTYNYEYDSYKEKNKQKDSKVEFVVDDILNDSTISSEKTGRSDECVNNNFDSSLPDPEDE